MSTTSAIASRIGLRRRINIASRLSTMAKANPDATALVMPTGKANGKYEYRSMTFAELDEDSSRLACLLYTSPSPRDLSTSRMPSSA